MLGGSALVLAAWRLGLLERARQACKAGLIEVDGKPAKPGLIPTLDESLENKTILIGTPEQVAEWYETGIQRIPMAMRAVTVPTVAAVHGAAVGVDDIEDKAQEVVESRGTVRLDVEHLQCLMHPLQRLDVP